LIATVIGIIVAYVPEGFPLSLALTLTFIARSMRKVNVLVKKLSTVETLGSINVICSDKTGTLTQNKMHVAELYVGLKPVTARNSIALYENNDESLFEMIKCLSLCNRAEYRIENTFVDTNEAEALDEEADNQRKTIVGDASDSAFLRYCQEFVNITSLRMKHKKLAEIPFHSKHKYMATIIREDADHAVLYMKGAAEIILQRCTSIVLGNGDILALTTEESDMILDRIEALAKQGKRVLAAAKLRLDPTQQSPSFAFNTEEVNFPMNNLCFIGLIALMDPPRPDVPDAMKTLRSAGIRVAMVTGDHPATAASIARMVGIISPDSPVIRMTADEVQPELENDTDHTSALSILGEHVAALSKTQWNLIVNQYKEIVFARTTPEQKLLIVKEYQHRGCIVAATGDGTNDAPALKQANVGISMGSGTDMAKEAADIILIDNKFSSIAVGVKYGRLAFDNLRKIVTYVLPAGNWSEMIPIFLSAFMGIPLPLSAFLMIIICVATDVAPALSLVTEPTEGDIMSRKPRVETEERLVDIGLFVRAFLFLGSIECVGALLMFFIYFYQYAGISPAQLFFAFDKWADGFGGYTIGELNEFLYTGQTIYFIALVVMQVGQLMTTRLSRYNFYQQWAWKNPNLFLGILIEIALTVAVVYLPLFNSLFKTRPPPVQYWFMPLVFTILVFMLAEMLKGVMRVFHQLRERANKPML
jgi:sodium/potassium-transporting ATPase subunit alpha